MPACLRVPEFANFPEPAWHSPEAKPMAGRSILCVLVPLWLPEHLQSVTVSFDSNRSV